MIGHLLTTWFGPGTWGAGGNLVAWVLCGIPAVLLALWHHRRQMRAEFGRLRARLDQVQAPQRPADAEEQPPADPEP